MKVIRMLTAISVLLFCAFMAAAQTVPSDAKLFSKDGVSFNYPAGWVMEDDSNQDYQQISLGHANGTQIRVLVHRGKVTADKMPQAKSGFIDPYIASTVKQFEQMGAKPEKSPSTVDIGTTKADGVIVKAMLDEPGAAQIYWALLNQHVVVLTLFGSDKGIKGASAPWEMVRNTLKIEDPKAAPSPSPKPTQ
jgi:hypothetical protein